MPRPLLHTLILIAAVFLLYRPTLDYGFLWDDQIYVVQNTAVHSWAHAADAFTSPNTTWSSNPQYNLAAWRPLRNISYIIDHSLYGLNPSGWHLTNILLHALATILLYHLIRRLIHLTATTSATPSDTSPVSAHAPMRSSDTAALLAAAFWAVHPVQTEVVAWIKSRDDLMATAFFFATLLVALPKRNNTTQRHKDAKESEENDQLIVPNALLTILAVLLFLCALLSKENTIILAALYPIILFLISSRTLRSLRLRVKHFLPSNHILLITFPLTALAYLLLHHHLLGRTAQAAHPGDTPLQTILTMLHAFTRYLQLIIWPWPPTLQSADYDNYPIITNPLNPRAFIGFIILSLLILITLRSLRPSRLRVMHLPVPLLAIGIALFLLALLPYSNLIPMMQILAERFLYLPLVGIAIILSSILIILSLFCSSSRLCVFASNFLALTLILALAYQTHHRLPVWQSELTLFTATRHANPTSWRPADLQIKALLKSQQTTASLHAANQALQQFPRDPDIVRTTALTHLLAGHETTGTQLTHYATQLQPNDFRASTTLQKWKQMQTRKQNTPARPQ